MSICERTLVISPPRKGNVIEFTDSKQELVLQAFAGKPTLDFGTVKINARVETALKIINPGDVDLEVTVSKAPDTFAAATKFTVPANNCVVYSVAWRPKEEGAVRKSINLSAAPGHPPIKTGIILVGKCVDPSRGPEWKRAARASVKAKPGAAKKPMPPPTKARPAPAASADETSSDVGDNSRRESEAKNLPLKKRGFFRATKTSTAKKQGKENSPPVTISAPPVVLGDPSVDATFVSGTKSPERKEASAPGDETFLVPPPPTPGPRETFVVVPQPNAALLVEAAAKPEAAQEEAHETVEEMQPPKFRFPGSLYKKRRSSTPVTSPKERFGSLRSTSEVVARSNGGVSRSPVLRFADAVSDKLDGVLTRSKSVSLPRKTNRGPAGAPRDRPENVEEPHGADSNPDPNSPTTMIEQFRRRMEEIKLGTGRKNESGPKKAPEIVRETPKVLKNRASKMNVKTAVASEALPVKVEKAVYDGMMEVDLNAEEPEADISMPSTIYSPEQPMDLAKRDAALHDIPEENELNDSDKENVRPGLGRTPRASPDGMLLGKLRRQMMDIFNSVSPRTAKKMMSDAPSPLRKHLATKRLMTEFVAAEGADVHLQEVSADATSGESTLKEGTNIADTRPAKPDMPLMILVSRKELASLRIQNWWLRRHLAKTRSASE